MTHDMHNVRFTDKERFNPTGDMTRVTKKKVFVLTLFIHVICDSKLSVRIYIFT